MHHYQHHIGDYRRDTMHLSLLEHGVYRQLLDLYYLHELPLDANALRLICARSADEINAAENVLKEFFEHTEKGYIHKRCDVEITKYRGKSESARNSAHARWDNNNTTENANALRTHSEGNANHKPITNNQSIYTIEFENFWKSYPKKVSKTYAFKAWKKHATAPFEEIIKGLEMWKRSDSWAKGFIHDPSTWLNQRRWEDELEIKPINGHKRKTI